MPTGGHFKCCPNFYINSKATHTHTLSWWWWLKWWSGSNDQRWTNKQISQQINSPKCSMKFKVYIWSDGVKPNKYTLGYRECGQACWTLDGWFKWKAQSSNCNWNADIILHLWITINILAIGPCIKCAAVVEMLEIPIKSTSM